MNYGADIRGYSGLRRHTGHGQISFKVFQHLHHLERWMQNFMEKFLNDYTDHLDAINFVQNTAVSCGDLYSMLFPSS
jgi:hypothetical protein